MLDRMTHQSRANPPDAQCATCQAMYYSADGHPTVARCGPCWHPLTDGDVRLFVSLGAAGESPRTGKHYVSSSFGTGVTSRQLRTLRTLEKHGHVSIGDTSFGDDYVAVHLKPSAVAAMARWCVDLDKKAGK